MRVFASLGMIVLIAAAATGCKLNNAPPAARMRHPGPGVDGPGPGVLPPPIRPGPSRELEGWLGQLEPGYEKMTEMLDELEGRERIEESLRKDRDYELEVFDDVYAEALPFVRSAFKLGGRSEKVIRALRPVVLRRRLKRKARRESEARAEGRRALRGGGWINIQTLVRVSARIDYHPGYFVSTVSFRLVVAPVIL